MTEREITIFVDIEGLSQAIKPRAKRASGVKARLQGPKEDRKDFSETDFNRLLKLAGFPGIRR